MLHWPNMAEPDSDWTTEYYAEMLVHEFVHNSVFLEDMVRGIMPEPELLERNEALSVSAIRQTRRPYDKAYHSACVTAAIMYYYRSDWQYRQSLSTPHPLCGEQLMSYIATTQPLKSRGLNLLTDNGREIIQDLQHFVDDPRYELIASSLARESTTTRYE